MLSKSAVYGLRASLYIATLKKAENEYVPVRQISDELGISFHFLAKILQSLTQRGILRSFRGPNGGVALASEASTIKLIDLVEALDGPLRFDQCILGLPDCGAAKPCPMHSQWAAAQDGIRVLLETSSLAEVSEKIIADQLRLS